MKAKQMICIALCLIVGSILGELHAQEHIKAVINKCVAMDEVEVTRIRNKERTVTTINFKNNDALVNEIAAACQKDESKAEQVIERKVNGKMVPNFYRFEKGSFSFKVEEKGVSATLIEYTEEASKGG